MNRILVLVGVVLLVGALGAMTLTALPRAHAQSVAVQVAASESTATFVIENMTCAMCPITVRKAMEKVSGVKSAEIDFVAKTATVLFDPAVTTTSAIAEASTNAGYPAHIQG